MLSTDLSRLERWFRGILSGDGTPTPEQCQAFLDGLTDVQRQAFELEKAAISDRARAPELRGGDNVIVLALKKKGGAA